MCPVLTLMFHGHNRWICHWGIKMDFNSRDIQVKRFFWHTTCEGHCKSFVGCGRLSWKISAKKCRTLDSIKQFNYWWKCPRIVRNDQEDFCYFEKRAWEQLFWKRFLRNLGLGLEDDVGNWSTAFLSIMKPVCSWDFGSPVTRNEQLCLCLPTYKSRQWYLPALWSMPQNTGKNGL